jgi:phosphonate transport system substrate-binding protein
VDKRHTVSCVEARRLILKAGMASLAWGSSSLSARAASERILIGTTPVFLDDRLGFLDAWRKYLEHRLDRPVAFVQRANYREVTDMLLEGAINCAWLCGYPFVRYHDRLQLLVVPDFKGAPLYQSYLIVPAEATSQKSLLQLYGKTFAFSDSLSNSGYLVPRYTLWSSGYDPDRYFQRTLFTWSHKKVVQAVSVGLVDGGAVDGYVWETLAKLNPDHTSKTRVAWKSQSFGFPPIVASRSMPPATAKALRNALTGMTQDTEGRQLLHQLNLDGFVTSSDHLFDPIEKMMRSLASAGKVV